MHWPETPKFFPFNWAWSATKLIIEAIVDFLTSARFRRQPEGDQPEEPRPEERKFTPASWYRENFDGE